MTLSTVVDPDESWVMNSSVGFPRVPGMVGRASPYPGTPAAGVDGIVIAPQLDGGAVGQGVGVRRGVPGGQGGQARGGHGGAGDGSPP